MGLKTKMQATCDLCSKEEEVTVRFGDFVELDSRKLLVADLPNQWSIRKRYDDVELVCDDCRFKR